MSGFRIHVPAALVAAVVLSAQAPAPSGSGGVAAPTPVQTQPLPPPAAAPDAPKPAEASPPQTAQPAPASPPPLAPPQTAEPPAAAPVVPAPPQQAAPAPPSGGPETATLAPGVTDPTGADEVMLAAKPAASLRGQAKWDGGFEKIQEALKTIRAEMAKANVKAAGRPLTIFVTSDDEKFTFEAMVPVDSTTDPKTAFGADVKMTQTPAGKAIRFGHKGPYDNIDETYEVLTAYLDAKGVEARDAFIEEYLSENLPGTDQGYELHIYVQPK